MKRIDKLLETVRNLHSDRISQSILCRLPDGTEAQLDLFDAMKAGAQFIRAMDGSHDFDELYIAVLNTQDEDFSDLPELSEAELL